ncbi:hypothetical protein F4775DRAFT_574888 [Biscogniauxia sp. FL1348]|nr:hypothetical protein F4775DRAFT_574888 [Biscogniauxia sp. FL1348]
MISGLGGKRESGKCMLNKGQCCIYWELFSSSVFFCSLLFFGPVSRLLPLRLVFFCTSEMVIMTAVAAAAASISIARLKGEGGKDGEKGGKAQS